MEQQETGRETHKSKPKQRGNRDADQVSHVDYVTANANSSQGESQLYIFEDNEAVQNDHCGADQMLLATLVNAPV